MSTSSNKRKRGQQRATGKKTTQQEELLPEVADMIKAAGSVITADTSIRLLNKVCRTNNVVLINNTWTDSNDRELTNAEFQKVWEEWAREIYVDEFVQRNALNTGAPQTAKYHVLPAIQNNPILMHRYQDVADAVGCEIVHAFSIYYMRVNDKRKRGKFHGGAQFHPDSFWEKESKFRLLDTLFTSEDGDKIFTIKDMETGEEAGFTIPHGSMLLLTSLAAGNHGDKYQHAVTGGQGTAFNAIDLL